VALQFVGGTQGVSPSWIGIIILAGFAAALAEQASGAPGTP
jgi:hypothetical protein